MQGAGCRAQGAGSTKAHLLHCRGVLPHPGDVDELHAFRVAAVVGLVQPEQGKHHLWGRGCQIRDAASFRATEEGEHHPERDHLRTT